MLTRIFQEDSFHRTIIHECHQGKNFAIIQQEKERDEWTIQNHIMLPKHLVTYLVELQLRQMRESETTGFDDAEEKEKTIDEKTLPENIRKLLFRYDSDCIPLYENQEGVWREMELLESFWGINTINSPVENVRSPALFEPLITTTDELSNPTPTTDQASVRKAAVADDNLTETPPVNSCFAPKKRRTNCSYLPFLQSSNGSEISQRLLFKE